MSAGPVASCRRPCRLCGPQNPAWPGGKPESSRQKYKNSSMNSAEMPIIRERAQRWPAQQAFLASICSALCARLGLNQGSRTKFLYFDETRIKGRATADVRQALGSQDVDVGTARGQLGPVEPGRDDPA